MHDPNILQVSTKYIMVVHATPAMLWLQAVDRRTLMELMYHATLTEQMNHVTLIGRQVREVPIDRSTSETPTEHYCATLTELYLRTSRTMLPIQAQP
jgi:hypothetical protein